MLVWLAVADVTDLQPIVAVQPYLGHGVIVWSRKYHVDVIRSAIRGHVRFHVVLLHLLDQEALLLVDNLRKENE